MNYNLKIKILETYQSQWRFAQTIDMHESDVSRVIAGRKKLPEQAKKNGLRYLIAP